MGRGKERGQKMVRVRQGVRNTYVPLIEGDPIPEDKPVDISGLAEELERLRNLENIHNLRGRLRGQKVRSV